MTIGSQVKQTIASLKGAKSTLESFAIIETNDEVTKIMKRNASGIGNVINDLEKRLGELEFEEPQYKGF
ncbi:MAG TPA: DUF1657 domain-containing protein [Desulfotomaculum sp.]|nr:MAG: hypothetical protein JL56_01050 [Desulfotomaculum sp. BICA1-6]HBX22124.1 DUF1657 domain-containing protein [Desulfotomaculum sp.]